MSVAISPDGRTLATDMQGSIWTMPAAGGAMTRVTDVFNDARQPMWSPDGRTITFFAYRDGGYDIWSINADGTNQKKLTWGAFDDREPIWSHDGTRVAFSSDRGNALGSDYNIWILDTAQRRVQAGHEGLERRLHADAGRPTTTRLSTPRPATTTNRCGACTCAAAASGECDRSRARASMRRRGAPAASCCITSPRAGRRASRSTANRSPATRTCSRSAPRGRRPRNFSTCRTARSAGARSPGLPMQTVEFTATMPVTLPRPVHAPRARLHLDDAAQDAGHRAAGDLA